MKLEMIIAAVLCAVVIGLGFIPSDTPVQADSIQTPALDSTAWLTQADEPTVAEPEVDTSLPPEEPTPSEPEAPNAAADSKSSCPANSKSGNHARASGERDGVLFDGDGYLIDRRPAASAAKGDVRHPLLRRLLGVDRRQNRRAAGRGVFGCRC